MRTAWWFRHITALVTAAAIVTACSGSGSSGPSTPTGVGNACVMQAELTNGGGAILSDLGVDTASNQCASKVCLQQFFQGRVTCPYGNGNATQQAGTCTAVPGFPGLFTLDGTHAGTLCCPPAGVTTGPADMYPVEAQCANRSATDSVYCSCRCDVPSTIDRSSVTLCACPSGFQCVAMIGGQMGKDMAGSYCVRSTQAAFTPDADPSVVAAACGPDKARP